MSLVPLGLALAGCGALGEVELAGYASLSEGQISATAAEFNDACPVGCGLEETCIASGCCVTAQACGAICCDAGMACSVGRCFVPDRACAGPLDCAFDEFCDLSSGTYDSTPDACPGAAPWPVGACVPRPPLCVDDQAPDPSVCVEACAAAPVVTTGPVGELPAWTGGSVAMAPIVLQLDDDNCDGVVDGGDRPEVVFVTQDSPSVSEAGTMVAVSLVDGAWVTRWAATLTAPGLDPGRELAGGNIDGLPGSEIVACADDGRVMAISAAGQRLWISDSAGACLQPALADLEGDGRVEILVPGAVLDGKTGAQVVALPDAKTSLIAADLDGDGALEIVGPHAVWAADGTVRAETGLPATFAGVADLDGDGVPEVVAVANGIDDAPHHLRVWRLDPTAPTGVTIVRAAIDLHGAVSPSGCPLDSLGRTRGGGSPAVADVDGDGRPDVIAATGVALSVFSGAALMNPAIGDALTALWSQPITQCRFASTAATAFDLDGDGDAEVVHADEQALTIYDGAAGQPLFSTCNPAIALRESPLVVDLDGDGFADILAVASAQTGTGCGGLAVAGLRGFTAAGWTRTRALWNQYAYTVGAIADDGTIIASPRPSWSPAIGGFRRNLQGQGETIAPDLIVTEVTPRCVQTYALRARIVNVGQATATAGVPVHFHAGDPAEGGALLGTLEIPTPLLPGAATELLLELPDAPPTLPSGEIEAHVRVDDPQPTHALLECRADNNMYNGSGRCP